jgi:hypothetical protein
LDAALLTNFGTGRRRARRYWAVAVESVDEAEVLGFALGLAVVLALPCPEGDGLEWMGASTRTVRAEVAWVVVGTVQADLLCCLRGSGCTRRRGH